MSKSFHLISETVRRNCISAILNAPDGYSVVIAERKRSGLQNNMFHALCEDIAKSGMKWAGKERNAADWKALLVSAHSVATGEGGEVIPGIEGEFVAIRESTSRMRVSRATSLIEYVMAFCALNEIELKETQKGGFMELTHRSGE